MKTFDFDRADGPISLTDSARAVLRLVSVASPITRPQLSDRLALSKVTMSAAVSELEAHGLVASQGTARGTTGRTAIAYGLGPQAGFVIGIDAGTTHVHAVAASLDRRILAEVERKSAATADQPRNIPVEIGQAIDLLLDRIGRDPGPLRTAALAVPTIVAAGHGPMRHQEFLAGAQQAASRLGVPMLVENNVNCAALAEGRIGAAIGRRSFIYLQVGVKIGLGIIIDGRLFRGFHGGAGEVGRLPFPWAPDRTPRFEGLEDYLGSTALMARCVHDWPADRGAPPQSAEELFARAATEAHARLCIERHAEDIGRLVAACVGILDPGFVVLGGGIGQNALLADTVCDTVATLTWPTEIGISGLTQRGTALGAVELAADYALATLLGEDPHPVFVLPAAAPDRGRLSATTR